MGVGLSGHPIFDSDEHSVVHGFWVTLGPLEVGTVSRTGVGQTKSAQNDYISSSSVYFALP
jgi:hypothetical protein